VIVLGFVLHAPGRAVTSSAEKLPLLPQALDEIREMGPEELYVLVNRDDDRA
jgi:hypothetical protein